MNYTWGIFLKAERQGIAKEKIRFTVVKSDSPYEDMSTKYDTVNILHSPLAGAEQSTLTPEAAGRFAGEAMPYIKDNPWDIAFCLQVQNSHQAMSREVLQSYLAKRSDAIEKNMSNHMIYNHLG